MIPIHQTIAQVKAIFAGIFDIFFKYFIYYPVKFILSTPNGLKIFTMVVLTVFGILLLIKLHKDTNGFKEFKYYH